MLAYLLALSVGLGSFGLYMGAFFFPEIHRKNDFLWSGIGLFYALVLWVCADRITGGLLLGQTAGVALLGWLGWQTVLLRRQMVPADQLTPVPTLEQVKAGLSQLTTPDGRSRLSQQVSQFAGQFRQSVSEAIAAAKQAQAQLQPPDPNTYVPPSLEEFGTAAQEAKERFGKAILSVEPPPAAPAAPVPAPALEPETIDLTPEFAPPPSTSPVAPPAPEPAASPEPTTAIPAVPLPSVPSPVDTPARLPRPRPVAPRPPAASADAGAPPVRRRPPTPVPPTPPRSPESPVKVITDTVRSLFPGSKKSTKPVYVRKQFRDAEAETVTTAVQRLRTATEAIVEQAELVVDDLPKTATDLGEAIVERTVPVSAEQGERPPEPPPEETNWLETDFSSVAPADVAEGVEAVEVIVEELLEDISAQEAQVQQAIAPFDPPVPNPTTSQSMND